MKGRTRILAVLMAAVMVAGSLTACGGKDSGKSEGGKSGKGGEQVLNYSTNSVVVGLNPILNTTAPDNAAHGMVQEPLLRNRTMDNNTNEVGPASAESFEVSEDGMTYTFKIRKEAKWSDGEPLTAKDFEYTLKLMADPSVAATNAWLYDGMIEGFTEALYDGADPQAIGVKAVDDSTLEIKIIHPAAYFPELICSLYPVRQDKYEEWGQDYGVSPEKTLYSGPFVVESWNQNTEMVLKKNENFWNAENTKVDKINYKVIQDNATAVQAYLNGELDITGTQDDNWVKQIEAAGDSNTFSVPASNTEFYMFNLGNEYLQNTKIRQALTIAFDREEFVETLFNGNAVVNESMLPDTTMVGDKTYVELVDGKNHFVKTLKDENPDPKKLFEEGLAELGKDTDTSKVTLRYATRGTDELSKKIGEYMKQSWEEALGITIQIDMMEWNIMWDKIEEGDYEIAQGGWGPYYNEPSGLLSIMEPEQGYFNANKTGWKNDDAKKFTELLNQAKMETDQQKLAEIYLQAEELLVKNAVISPVYQLKSSSFIKKYVEGYYICTNGNTDWSQVSVNK